MNAESTPDTAAAAGVETDPPASTDPAALGEPVDTLEEPHEPVVVTRSTIGLWALTLAGPVLWIVHFMFVYLTAEAACEAARVDEMRFVGEGTLRTIVLVATAVGAVACLVAGAVAWRRRHRVGQPEMSVAGAMLAVGSALSVVAVGLPALVLGPC